MSSRTESDAGSYDIITILLFISLVAIGWSMIFAVEYEADTFNGVFNLQKNYGKQLLFIAVSAVLFGIIQLIDAKIIEIFAIVFYVFCMLLLVGVLFTKPINGSTSWYHIGGFSLQPSEFAKMATCLLLSSFLGRSEVRVQNIAHLGQAALIILIPMGLVLLQGDLGSTLVYLSFSIMLFRAGLNATIYILGLLLIALSILALKFDDLSMIILILLILGNTMLAWIFQQNWLHLLGATLASIASVMLYTEGGMLTTFIILGAIFVTLLILNLAKNWQFSILIATTFVLSVAYAFSVSNFVNNILMPHQQERIWVWLRPEKCDPQGALYNVEQSKYAIGSGGALGKGFLQGERTKLDYVPEQSTDFIFCTVGEEWGFIGTSIVILLFLGFLIRILQVAERQRGNFTRYYAYGAVGILFFHFLINIGMTIGLIPVVGIPLPLISYGGSSLFAFSILIAVLVKLDSNRIF
jgi:rod shape determining protein RodA